MIGERIKQARIAGGHSQESLAKLVGVSTMAISKYERGAMAPGSEVLLHLASALCVRTEYFFRQVELEISDPDFRKHKTLSGPDQNRVIAQMRESVERWIDLEQLSPTTWSKPFALPDGIPSVVRALDDIEIVAEKVRSAWGLGNQPICDLSDFLERQGIKVFLLEFDAGKRWDGLVAKANGEPVIVIGADWPGDRQRFTLAHELGHVILHGRLRGELADADDEERACHRFAGAFLMPKSAIETAFGSKRSWIEPRELLNAKLKWGLSMNAMIYRARDADVLSKANAGKMFGYFKKRNWHVKEPGPEINKEVPMGFERYVFRALGEDLISEGKAADLLKTSISNLRRKRSVASEATDANKASDQ